VSERSAFGLVLVAHPPQGPLDRLYRDFGLPQRLSLGGRAETD